MQMLGGIKRIVISITCLVAIVMLWFYNYLLYFPSIVEHYRLAIRGETSYFDIAYIVLVITLSIVATFSLNTLRICLFRYFDKNLIRNSIYIAMVLFYTYAVYLMRMYAPMEKVCFRGNEFIGTLLALIVFMFVSWFLIRRLYGKRKD
jgi:hypothetical protein